MNKRLKEIRLSKGLSQKEFGNYLNLSQNHISSLESGARSVTSRIITDICSIFHVNREWLTTGKGEMFKDELEELNIKDPEIEEFVRLYLQADQDTRKYIKGLMEKTIK